MPLLAATAVASAAFSFWHDGKYGGASRMRWGIAASTTVALAASMVLLALRGFLDADDRGAVLSWLAFVHAFQAFACWFFLPRAIRREALFVCAAYGLVRHSNSAVTPSASAPTSPLQA
jgi:FtsH-binding integral membrane protein